MTQYNALALAEFEVSESLIEHKKQGAPKIIIKDLEKALYHLQKAIHILSEGDNL